MSSGPICEIRRFPRPRPAAAADRRGRRAADRDRRRLWRGDELALQPARARRKKSCSEAAAATPFAAPSRARGPRRGAPRVPAPRRRVWQPRPSAARSEVIEQVGRFRQQLVVAFADAGERDFEAFLADLLRDAPLAPRRTAAPCSCLPARGDALRDHVLQRGRGRRCASAPLRGASPKQVACRGGRPGPPAAPAPAACRGRSRSRRDVSSQVCPEVSPFLPEALRLRLQNTTRRRSSVAVSAAEFM